MVATLVLVGPAAPAAAAGAWAAKTPLATARAMHEAAAVNGKLYVFGGTAGGCPPPALGSEEYDPVTDAWTPRAAMPLGARSEFGSAALNGHIYAFGGGNCLQFFDDVVRYDPVGNAWTILAPMPSARSYRPVAAAVNARIYLIGGCADGACTTGVSPTLEYDPLTGAWAPKAPMLTPRIRAAGGVIGGKIYVAGGGTVGAGGQPVATLESYDPATNAWSVLAPMPVARTGAAAGVIGGRLYVFGGTDFTTTGSAQVYDPATNAWSAEALPAPATSGASAAVLNGTLYMSGGQPATGFSGANLAFTPASLPATTTSLTSNLNPSGVGQSVTFTATVSGGTGAPTGSVTFKDGAAVLNVATLGAGGTATYTTSSLAAGTHPITAEYGGSASHAASTTAVLSQVVTQLDTVAPVSTVTTTPGPTNGWNNTDVAVTVSATDSGSGVASTTVTLNGASVGTSFTIEAEGIHTVVYFSTDKAGNREAPRTLIVRIDRTAPEALIRFDPAALDLAVAGYDALSSGASVTFSSAPAPEDGPFSGEEAVRRTYLITDNAGNVTILAVDVRADRRELHASAASLRYGAGPVLVLAKNEMDLKWDLADDRSLRKLDQEVAVGGDIEADQDGDFAGYEFRAKYRAGRGTTITVEEPKPRTVTTRPELALLRLETASGALLIRY